MRIGLIGCGRIAERFHLPALVALDGVEVTAIADVDPARRERCHGLAPRATWFDEDRALLERGELDAVVICHPPALHARAATAAFGRGLHVYLEKPIATTIEDANRMIVAWKEAGTVGQVGFNLRFHRLVGALRAAVRQKCLGEVIGVRTVFSASRHELPEWKRARRSGGGALLDLAGHHFDLARFLFDQEIVEVGAMVRSVATEEDTAVVELRLAEGPLITVLTSLAAVEEDRVEVYGSRGRLALDRYRSSRLNFVPARRDFRAAARLRAAGATLAAGPRRLRDAMSPPRERSFAAALAAFADAARGGAPAGPDLRDGLCSLAAVLAAETAARSGQTVRLAAVPA